jgi:hypothetical protein
MPRLNINDIQIGSKIIHQGKVIVMEEKFPIEIIFNSKKPKASFS